MAYSHKSARRETEKNILSYLRKVYEQRESLAAYPDSTGVDAPKNAWDMGTRMWTPGYSHLPDNWVNEVCPKNLQLREVPVLKVYRVIVEQMTAALLAAMPKVTFAVDVSPSALPTDMAAAWQAQQAVDLNIEAQIPSPTSQAAVVLPGEEPPIDAGQYVSDILNGAWRKFTEDSRLLSEFSLAVIDSLNYSIGWLGLHTRGSETYGKAIHPQIVLWNLDAERPYELEWVAKMVTRAREDSTGALYQGLPDLNSIIAWPNDMLKKTDGQELEIEIFVRRGGLFAGHRYEDAGAHIIMRTSGEIKLDEPWHHDKLPITPVCLEPEHGLFGTSLARELWNTQVAIDKTLAVMLSRASRASGETIQLSGLGAGGTMPEGVRLTNTDEKALTAPGTRIIAHDGDMKIFPPPPMAGEYGALLSMMISNMERIAGITPAWQGHVPRGVESGIAIMSLAKMGGRRIDRMAGHLVEAIRDFANMWASVVLDDMGLYDRGALEVRVVLEINEENTRDRQYQAVLELARAGVQLPPGIFVDVVPGLTDAQRRTLKRDIESMEQQRLIMGIRGMQEPAAGLPPQPVAMPEIGAGTMPPVPPAGDMEQPSGEGV